jgi:hypothetical protein
MQHTHVKRKENRMNRNMLDDSYADLERYRRLAERERARAIGQGLAWLRRHLLPRFEFGPRQWIERLG